MGVMGVFLSLHDMASKGPSSSFRVQQQVLPPTGLSCQLSLNNLFPNGQCSTKQFSREKLFLPTRGAINQISHEKRNSDAGSYLIPYTDVKSNLDQKPKS